MNLLDFKQAFRNLYRNRIYTFVNLVGLGVSSTFILLVAAYVTHSVNRDRFSPSLKNIYRIETSDLWTKPDTAKKRGFFDWLAKDADQHYQLVCPLILGEELKKTFPEINSICRIQTDDEAVILTGKKRFQEEGDRIAFVDPNFFSFFDFPLLTGKEENAFNDRHSVVLSQRAARKYFGTENPVGKVLSLKGDEGNLFTVSAVAKDFSLYSSMQFDVLFCLQGQPDYEERLQSGLNQSSFLTLVQLQPNTKLAAFKNKLALFGESYLKEWVETGRKFHPGSKDISINLSIRSFSESHFNSSAPWFYYTDVKSLYELVFLALVALTIACLNYILLSLSRVAIRSHEAGVRKTVGAGWFHIMELFLTETFVLVLLSVMLGFLMAIMALPYFNALTKMMIRTSELLNPQFLSLALLLILLLSFIAGIYPAIKMAGIRPLKVLGKFATYKINPSLSRIFIALQYTACMVLIVLSIVIARQIEFVHHKDLGFDQEETLLIRNPFWGDKIKTLSIREQLRQYAASQPGIMGVTGANFRFGKGFNQNGHNINGKKEMIAAINVDYDYFELNKISLEKGRFFTNQFPTDTARLALAPDQLDSLGSRSLSNMVVNETLYNLMGHPSLNVINKALGGVIIGVCKDYFFTGLQQKIGPAYHICHPDRIGYFWVRMNKSQRISGIVSNLKAAFTRITNGEQFNFSFMDEDVNLVYESHERWLKVISIASWMAIMIACLGLFGLSAIVAVSRTKEIGIRKVLGASLFQLFYSLNKQSLVMVMVSILTSVPLAIFVCNNWLENFAYRIHLTWTFFVLGALIGLLCALGAVSYHTLKAARVSPVKSLRST